eukprot:COSAG06_NODE_193_length_20595_cov_74.920765_7_plen_117_part_00
MIGFSSTGTINMAQRRKRVFRTDCVLEPRPVETARIARSIVWESYATPSLSTTCHNIASVTIRITDSSAAQYKSSAEQGRSCGDAQVNSINIQLLRRQHQQPRPKVGQARVGASGE